MYVTPGTTQKEIKAAINRNEEQLKDRRLSPWDREAIHEELDYLYSFVQEED